MKETFILVLQDIVGAPARRCWHRTPHNLPNQFQSEAMIGVRRPAIVQEE